MRISLLIRALTPGGAERQAVLTASLLKARGHAVEIIVFYRTGGELEAQAEDAGVTLTDLGKRSRWDLLRPLARLRRHVRTTGTDVVYPFLPTANVLAALLWGRAGRPAVVAGIRGTTAVRASHDWLGQLLIRAEDRLAGRFAAAIVNSTSGAAERCARGWDPARLHVIRNGLPAATPGFDAAARAAARAAWGVAPGERVVGFAGRLDPVKRVEDLLAAVARLRAAGAPVRLVIAGGGPAAYAAALRDHAAGLGDAVRFLGHQPQLAGFYSAIDLLCLPSATEGCSNVIAEALATGTPVVATAVGEADFLIDDHGCLARPGDVTDLVRALRHGLDAAPVDRAVRRRQVLARLDAEAMAAATECVLARACGRDPVRPEVLFVTMVFPWPSEAFAGVEVRALQAGGARVRVRALRGPHPRASALLADWGLAGLDVTSSGARPVLRGLGFAAAHPVITMSALGWLLRHAWRRPGLLLRCLALTPRMLDIFRECWRQPPESVYLFWGHYPAWLGHLLLRCLPGVHVAQCFSAYDLLYAFPPALDLARRAHSLWTITAANRPVLTAQGLPAAQVRIAAHGLDLTRIPEPPAERDPCHLVTVARLEPNKGVDDVLRVTHALVAAGLPVRLTVIGEGPDRARLDALARELGITGRVRFTGGIGHSQVLGELAAAGVFLLLSRSPAERVPNAAKEALAVGCLCVLTTTPGVEELTGGLEHPLVVAPGDWERAVALVADVVARPGHYAGDRARGRDHVRRCFDAHRIARERLRVWAGDARLECEA